MSDDLRAETIISALKKRAEYDQDLIEKLAYVSAFRLVPRSRSLRFGFVREVATGKILVDNSMTSDPWLLIGLAIRRSPWIYDPRYLERPFYYRTESAPLTTLLVLQHARHCPPFAIYQLGHTIRDGKHTVFHFILHKMKIHIEEPVLEDGTYDFHRLSRLLLGLGKTDRPKKRPIWTDDEVILDVQRRLGRGEDVSVNSIAEMYIYPLKYVNEVMLGKISNVADGGTIHWRLES